MDPTRTWLPRDNLTNVFETNVHHPDAYCTQDMVLVETRRFDMGSDPLNCLPIVTKKPVMDGEQHDGLPGERRVGGTKKRDERTHSHPGSHTALSAHAAGRKTERGSKSCQTNDRLLKFVFEESIGISYSEVGKVEPPIFFTLVRGRGC